VEITLLAAFIASNAVWAYFHREQVREHNRERTRLLNRILHPEMPQFIHESNGEAPHPDPPPPDDEWGLVGDIADVKREDDNGNG
jgi:hypothetical protein